MLWRGDEASLLSFMDRLNLKNKNIILTWQYDRHKIVFLDVEICVQGGEILTKNYCKPTDRKGYIAIDSWHHKPWLLNIPKGQFIQLTRNCTNNEEFEEQTVKFGEKFIQKGYNAKLVNKQLEEVKNMERKDLLKNKEKVEKKDGEEYRMVLSYNFQKNKIENIIRKHWNVLLRDNVFGGALPRCPSFVYKKAPNLTDILAPGVLDPPNKGNNVGTLTPFLTVFYTCERCLACRTIKGIM